MAITRDGLYQREYNAAGSLRFALEDTSGNAAPGKLSSDITAIATYYSDGTSASPAIVAGDWHELGNGVYDVDLTAEEIAAVAGETTVYLLVSGCKPRWAYYLVTASTASDRILALPDASAVENAVLDASETSHVAAGSVGLSIKIARAIVNNKMTLAADGTWILYDDDGVTPLVTKTMSRNGVGTWLAPTSRS